MRRKRLLPDPDGPMIVAQSPLASVISNGPASSLRSFLTMSAGVIAVSIP
jgi:hypothetical protein